MTVFRVKLFFFSLLLLLIGREIVPPGVAAQNISTDGVGYAVSIEDSGVTEGAIVSFQNRRYVLSTTPYDPNILGVIVNKPALSVTDSTLANSKLVVSSGTVTVLVSTKNGAIKKGDFITTSTTKGVGEKATDNGYILGSADEDYNGSAIGQIAVVLHPQFGQHVTATKQDLYKTIKLGLSAPALSPVNALRYILAAIMVLSSFFIGFVFFGKASSKGIEAIGRNPLARKVITLTVLLNVFLTMIIVIAGVAVSYLILVL